MDEEQEIKVEMLLCRRGMKLRNRARTELLSKERFEIEFKNHLITCRLCKTSVDGAQYPKKASAREQRRHITAH